MITILTLLVIKHFFIDFVNQTEQEVYEKGIYLKKYGINHSLKHGLLTIVILLAVTKVDIALCYLIGLIEFLVHYHIDWAKMNLNKHYNLTINDKWYWILLGFDQLLHYLTYIAILVTINV